MYSRETGEGGYPSMEERRVLSSRMVTALSMLLILLPLQRHCKAEPIHRYQQYKSGSGLTQPRCRPQQRIHASPRPMLGCWLLQCMCTHGLAYVQCPTCRWWERRRPRRGEGKGRNTNF